MKKIKKAHALRLFLAGYPVWLCPSKCYPAPKHPWNLSHLVQLNDSEKEEFNTLQETEVFEKAVNSFRYYNCTEETGLRVTFYVEKVPDVKVFFVGDNAQYIHILSNDGYFGPFVGIGENEADAYQDARTAFSGELCSSLLPKRKGAKRRGMAYYFGRDVAREVAKSDSSDLHIYCVIYISK